jgi:DNA-binding HxlR family transcriptional regulator
MPPKRAEPLADDCVPGVGCQIGDLFRLLGKSHVMRILYLFLKEEPRPHRFVDVQHRLDLSPNTLTQRLKELVEAGLLTRTAYNEIPKKAKELDAVFVALAGWARRNNLEPVPAAEKAAA